MRAYLKGIYDHNSRKQARADFLMVGELTGCGKDQSASAMMRVSPRPSLTRRTRIHIEE